MSAALRAMARRVAEVRRELAEERRNAQTEATGRWIAEQFARYAPLDVVAAYRELAEERRALPPVPQPGWRPGAETAARPAGHLDSTSGDDLTRLWDVAEAARKFQRAPVRGSRRAAARNQLYAAVDALMASEVNR